MLRKLNREQVRQQGPQNDDPSAIEIDSSKIKSRKEKKISSTDRTFSFCQSEFNSDIESEVNGLLQKSKQVSQLNHSCEGLVAVLGAQLSKRQSTFFDRIKQATRNNEIRTFNNIEIESIAREKIIPYVSEAFLNISRVIQSPDGRDSRSLSGASRNSMRRNSRSSNIHRDDQRNELRRILKVERLVKIISLRIGFSAITELPSTGILKAESKSMASVSQSSVRELLLNTSRSSRISSRKLQVRIIGKYMRRLVLHNAFRTLKLPLVAFQIQGAFNMVQQSIKRRLEEGLRNIQRQSTHNKYLVRLMDLLGKKQNIRQTHFELCAFFKMRTFVKDTASRQRIFGGISSLHQLLAQKRLKLLFSGFIRIYQGSLTKDISDIPPNSPQQQQTQVTRDFRQFLSTLHLFMEGRMQYSAFKDCSLFGSECEATALSCQQSLVSLQSEAAETEMRTISRRSDMPTVQIGSSLPFDAIIRDEPILLGKRATCRTRTSPLKPLSQDYNNELQSTGFLQLTKIGELQQTHPFK